MGPFPDLRFSLTPLEDIADLAMRWRDLEARADVSFFQSWSWIGTWLASLPTGFRPLVAHCDAAGETVALGILVASRRRRHLFWRPRRLSLNETGVAEYDSLFIEHNGFVADRRADPSLVALALRKLAETVPSPDEIRLGGVDAGALPPAAPGWELVIDKSAPLFSLDLHQEGIADLRRFGRNTRQQIRRTRRDYAALGPIEIDAAGQVPEALAFLKELEMLHEHSWRARGRTGAFARPGFGEFHRRLIATCHQRGEIELLRIRAGDRTVGLLYNFVHRGRVYAYQSGFDYGLLPRGRPGLLCHALAIERHRTGGARLYDFLAGDNRLKRSLSTATAPLYWATWQRATSAARCELRMKSIIALLRGRLPPR